MRSYIKEGDYLYYEFYQGGLSTEIDCHTENDTEAITNKAYDLA